MKLDYRIDINKALNEGLDLRLSKQLYRAQIIHTV